MKKKICTISILFLITVAVTIEYLVGFNSYDTQKIISMGYLEYAKKLFWADGRIFSGLYICIGKILNIANPTNLYIFSVVLCIFLIIGNVIYFKRLLEKISTRKINEGLLYVLSYITIFNFTYSDIMTFIEMPILQLSIFLYMLAAKFAVIDKNKKKMLLTLILAIFMYQGTINVFFIMIVFFILQKYRKLDKKNIKEIVKLYAYSAIPIVINFMYIKIYGMIFNETDRMGSLDFASLISRIVYSLNSMIRITSESIYTMPRYLYIFLVLDVLIFAYLIAIFKAKKTLQNTKDIHQYMQSTYNIILLIIISVISCIPLIVAFQVLLLYYCGRLFWPIGASLGLILLELVLNTNCLENKKLKLSVLTFITIYMLILYPGMYRVVCINKEGNNVDKEICYQVKNEVDEYEKNTGKKIEKIKIYLEYKENGGLSEKYKNIKLAKSCILIGLPMTNLLHYYCDMNCNIGYTQEKVVDFEKDLDFYFNENILYVYTAL